MANRFALIIANYEYQDPMLRKLVAPAQDAEALAGVLRDPEIGGFETMTILNQVSSLVRQEIGVFFTKRKRDDLLFLYFSGHGIKDDFGRLYYATTDTERSRLRSTAVSANYVNELMRESRSRQQVLLLDCCYSGAFAKGMMVKADKSVGTAEQFVGKGHVILTASDSVQYAFEGDSLLGEAECSIFTQAVIDGLQTGQADLDQNGLITIDELYDYVHGHVTEKTPKQIPGMWAFDVQGDIVVAKNPHPVTKPVELPIELHHSINDLRSWVREGAVQELGRLLKSGEAGLERSAHSALESMLDDDSLRVRNLVLTILDEYSGTKTYDEVKVESGSALKGATWLSKKLKDKLWSIKVSFPQIPKWVWITNGLIAFFIVVSWLGSQYQIFRITAGVTDTVNGTSTQAIAPSVSFTSTQTNSNTSSPSPTILTSQSIVKSPSFEEQSDHVNISVPASDDSSIVITSFNISFLGASQERDDSALAMILEESDIVVIQELIAPPFDGKFPDGSEFVPDKEAAEFFNAMNSLGFKYELSVEDTGPEEKNHSNWIDTEWWVAFYKEEKVKIAEDLPTEFLAEDRTNHEFYNLVPHSFAFRTVDGRLDFVLISVHLYYIDKIRSEENDAKRVQRQAELASIAAWVNRHDREEKDFIILGTLNVNNCEELQDIMPDGFRSLNEKCEATDAYPGSTYPLDHVLYRPEYTREIDTIYGFNVINLMEALRPSSSESYWGYRKDAFQQFKALYSDKFPVVFKMNIFDTDDD